MKLKDIFVTETINDTQIMVSLDSSVLSGLIRSNKTAAFIVDCLKEETSEEEILKKMQERYDGPEELMRSDIRMITAKLRDLGALEE